TPPSRLWLRRSATSSWPRPRAWAPPPPPRPQGTSLPRPGWAPGWPPAGSASRTTTRPNAVRQGTRLPSLSGSPRPGGDVVAAIDWLGSLPGHIQYGSFLFGPGTRWRWDELQGWEETPAVDSGTVLRSTQHGAWPGVFLAQSRTVTFSLVIKSEPGEMNATVRQFAAATPIDSENEVPLVVQLDEEAPLLIYARCDRRTINVGRSNRTGLARGAIQFVASDPRRYSLLESSVITELPMPEDGLEFPLSFPLDWGETGSTGNVECVNSGDALTHPTIEIHGPCDTPS